MKTKFLKIMLTYTEVTSGFSGMSRAVANTYFTPSSFYALKERITIKRNDRDAKLKKKMVYFPLIISIFALNT